ncbi:hypothetical protein QBC41DRAFT_228464 [Cercophora samala]|uniref:Uncharacterized protein n=1 Tax=Cercophora samala TaxID=330535 RepID=A0AA40D8P4_9PEZI|nr:hypothetical protein QBC41DRAFT_228464 [Cercophora samala]
MHFLIPTVALLSQSVAVFGAAVPKPAPAAASVPVVVENAPLQAAVTQQAKVNGEPNVEIVKRTPTTLLQSFIPTPVDARDIITDEHDFSTPPPNPFWPPLPPPPQKLSNQTFSPHCHLKTKEECDRIR